MKNKIIPCCQVIASVIKKSTVGCGMQHVVDGDCRQSGQSRRASDIWEGTSDQNYSLGSLLGRGSRLTKYQFKTLDCFQIGRVCQGCILSPYLFNFYAEYIMRKAGLEETQAGIKIAGRNISGKSEETEPKQKQYLVMDVTGDGSKVWCCKSNIA